MKPYIVLIVEDDEWQAEHMVRSLEREGITSHVSPSAMHAIEDIDQVHPDAVILDMMLPGSNGIALMHELQSHNDLAKIPVIVCSNSADGIPEDVLKTYGVVTVIDKSTLEPGDLAAAIRKALP